MSQTKPSLISTLFGVSASYSDSDSEPDIPPTVAVADDVLPQREIPSAEAKPASSAVATSNIAAAAAVSSSNASTTAQAQTRECSWRKCVDDKGRTYYFNEVIK